MQFLLLEHTYFKNPTEFYLKLFEEIELKKKDSEFFVVFMYRNYSFELGEDRFEMCKNFPTLSLERTNIVRLEPYKSKKGKKQQEVLVEE